MFDATTKFPSGILYGSSYDFGNFDECIEVRMRLKDEKLYGKYCMAKFTVNYKPQNVEILPRLNNRKEDSNSTVWNKIAVSVANIISFRLTQNRE